MTRFSVRRKVFESQEFECDRCGAAIGYLQTDGQMKGHVHHETPRSQGGTDMRDNLNAVCIECHHEIHGHEDYEVPETADDLTQTDEAILSVLQRDRDTGDPWGLATKGYLVDETGFSRNSVYNRLEVLEQASCVREVHEPTRLFAFVEDPREDGTDGE